MSRFLIIAGGVVLFFISYFPVYFPQYSSAYIAAIFVLLFAFPAFMLFIKEMGWIHGLMLLGILSFFALSVETLGILTGIPYGNFFYTDTLAWKLFGLTPWSVPFAWVPLVLASVYFSKRIHISTSLQYALSIGILVLTDMVIDPGAVALGYWRWEHPGLFYGVPLVNFLGWVVSGGIGTFILYRGSTLFGKTRSYVYVSWFWILSYWVGVDVWKHLWIPVFCGIMMLSVCLRHIWKSPDSLSKQGNPSR